MCTYSTMDRVGITNKHSHSLVAIVHENELFCILAYTELFLLIQWYLGL